MEPAQISSEQLEKLADGLRVMELVVESGNLPEMWVYILTSNQEALFKAQDSLQESGNSDLDEDAGDAFEAPKLTEIAIAIPGNADHLYYLVGSGFRLQNETFAYKVAGEGARTEDFTWSRTPAKLKLSDVKAIELADSDINLGEFMERNGTTSSAPQPKAVTRNQEATKPKPSNNPIDRYLAS